MGCGRRRKQPNRSLKHSKMIEFCPLCLLKGKTTELKYLQMNLEEATKMCTDVQCIYPFNIGCTDVFIKRNFMDLEPELKPPPNKNAVPIVPNEQQHEQSTIQIPSSIVKTTNSFEELNSWCNTEFMMPDQGTTTNEKLDDLSHMDVSNFSNEELMKLFDFEDSAKAEENFEDSAKAEEKEDFCIDFELDRLLEEKLRDVATDNNGMALLDNDLGDLNIEKQINSNMMETDIHYFSSGGHRYDTNEALRNNHTKIKDKPMSNVGEKKLDILKSQRDNLKFAEPGINNVVEHCLSQEEINNLNNRSTVQVAKSENFTNSLIPELSNLGEKSQLIVVKCKENIDLPVCNDLSKNVVSVTYIDKQNGQKVIYPNPSHKSFTSHQQPNLKKQILFPQCKNAKTSKKNKNKCIKREEEGRNELTFDWNSVANNIALVRNREGEKQIRKGSEIQNAGEKLKQLDKFQGFSFQEALKSVSKPDIQRGFKTSVKIQRSQPNMKVSGNKPIQFGAKELKGRNEIKSQCTSETSVINQNESCSNRNSGDNNFNWIKDLFL